jgi:hypothetical protein
MVVVKRSKPKVVSAQKKVKEHVVRFQSDGAISANAEDELYPFEGSSGNPVYEAPNGEGIELIAMGINTVANLDFHRITDKDGTEWNKFLTQNTVGYNEMPMNQMYHFEHLMRSWGFGGFLSPKGRQGSVAPTLKLSEGDEIRVYANAGASAVTSAHYGAAIVRRYLQGSEVDYRHFNYYDGGLKSQKWFYNDYQKLTATTAGQWTQAWILQVLRNEGYKFFTGGVLSVTNLVEARINIDYPTTEYNKYFVAPTYNQLPYVNTYALNTGYDPTATAEITRTSWIDTMHRFIPTIDILKNRNKDLRVYLKDGGSQASTIYTRMIGVKYNL